MISKTGYVYLVYFLNRGLITLDIPHCPYCVLDWMFHSLVAGGVWCGVAVSGPSTEQCVGMMCCEVGSGAQGCSSHGETVPGWGRTGATTVWQSSRESWDKTVTDGSPLAQSHTRPVFYYSAVNNTVAVHQWSSPTTSEEKIYYYKL